MTKGFLQWIVAQIIARTNELSCRSRANRLEEIRTKDGNYLKAIAESLPVWMEEVQEGEPQAGDADLILGALHLHYFPKPQLKE